MVPCHGALDVGEQLLVAAHHLFVVGQLEVYLDHLFERLEAPLALLPILQVEHLLETVECRFRFILLERLAVVVLVLQVHVRLRVAVLRVDLQDGINI